MKTQISAGLIIYRHTPDGIKFLLVYHGHNYWNFPKGKIEPNEKIIQTALREVREETGLKSKDIKLIKNFRTSERFIFRDRVNKDKVFKIITFYLAETTQETIKLPTDEHLEGYAWFLYPEAKRILHRYKNTQEIITKAYNLIKNPDSAPVTDKPIEAPSTHPKKPVTHPKPISHPKSHSPHKTPRKPLSPKHKSHNSSIPPDGKI